MWNVSQRELENLWNQVEKEKKKKKVENERDGERKEWELLESSGSKEEKKKGENVLMMGICVWWTKCKREKKGTYGWKKRQRIRYHNLKIIP